MAQCASPVGMGKKDKECIHAGVAGAMLLPLFLLEVRMCSVCKGEGGKIEGLVPIILRARLVRWVSLRPCTAYSAGAGLILLSQPWLVLEVRAPLNPVLVACHRFKRTQLEILISQYALS